MNVLFYGRDGAALNAEQVREISNSGVRGYDNDYLVDPATMRAVSAGPLKESPAGLAFSVPSVPVALAMNWPTDPLGYSLLIVDNGGGGFTAGGTINFTYQAALDVKRKLDEALAARSDYPPSQIFQSAYSKASALLGGINASSSEPEKGAAGQLALDALAVAYDALLSEHGPMRAGRPGAMPTPWLGFTVDSTDKPGEALDLAANLTRPYGWVRIVFESDTRPSDYMETVNAAKSRGLKVLGQPVDSSAEARYSRDEYRQRFIDFLTAFPQIDAWEVGNEVNGSWVSSSVVPKISDAIAEVKSRAPGKPAVLTLFWQINTDEIPFSMFTWINANLPPSTRSGLDAVLVSLYPEQAPMGVCFDQMMKTLRSEFPTQLIGIGELGYWIEGNEIWWAFDKNDPNGAARRAVASQYYRAALDYPGSIGGGFWWNFLREFPDDPAMQETISRIRDSLQGSSQNPTPAPTETPTPTPGPTPTPHRVHRQNTDANSTPSHSRSHRFNSGWDNHGDRQ